MRWQHLVRTSESRAQYLIASSRCASTTNFLTLEAKESFTYKLHSSLTYCLSHGSLSVRGHLHRLWSIETIHQLEASAIHASTTTALNM